METIVLAGGCFWGLQHFLSQFPGVIRTTAGYAQGTLEYPTYRQVCSQQTGHTEAVRVDFDPAKISLRQLLDAFFAAIDPTQRNRQGNDIGTNYRTGIYWTNDDQIPAIEKAMEAAQRQYHQPIVTEAEPLRAFYPAETEHQDYLYKHPGGYCHIPVNLFRTYRLPSQEELDKLDGERR